MYCSISFLVFALALIANASPVVSSLMARADNCTNITASATTNSFNATGRPTTWTITAFACPANSQNLSCPIYAVGGLRVTSTLTSINNGTLPTSINATAIFAQLSLSSSITGYISTVNATNATNYFVPSGNVAHLEFTPDVQCFGLPVSDCEGVSQLEACVPIAEPLIQNPTNGFYQTFSGRLDVVLGTGGIRETTALSPPKSIGSKMSSQSWLWISALIGMLLLL